ncbi:MAG: NADH-quinone oxidoreductase subunit J [Phycisphaerales bacterium]|nr:NADH-quinone oxidoreductase subunit J [Phycisphaerales bacterium]
MNAIVNPLLLYVGLAVGAVGVLMALPRRKVNPQIIGAVIAAAALGGVILHLGLRAADAGQMPNINFYLFAGIAILAGLRVVTHQRPVYSALFFILTVLSSAAMYVMLGAEFLAFALIIIYAGAILITYLFVIMLATQAPSEEEVEALSPYDAEARDPVMATAMGFLLLAGLTGMLAQGVGSLDPAGSAGEQQAIVAHLPGKVMRDLNARGVFDGLEKPAEEKLHEHWDVSAGTVTLRVTDRAALEQSMANERVAELVSDGGGEEVVVHLPSNLKASNIDGVGWALIAGHPMSLELAGVVLLMAMLGAVVLARKQVELGEAAKARAVQFLHAEEED